MAASACEAAPSIGTGVIVPSAGEWRRVAYGTDVHALKQGVCAIHLGHTYLLATVEGDPGRAETICTANVMAASKDLLAALVEILGPLNVCSDNPHVRDDESLPIDLTMGELRKARAAIAKARGQ